MFRTILILACLSTAILAENRLAPNSKYMTCVRDCAFTMQIVLCNEKCDRRYPVTKLTTPVPVPETKEQAIELGADCYKKCTTHHASGANVICWKVCNYFFNPNKVEKKEETVAAVVEEKKEKTPAELGADCYKKCTTHHASGANIICWKVCNYLFAPVTAPEEVEEPALEASA